jgi:lipocalin
MRKLAFALAILLPVIALAGPVRDLSQPMLVVEGFDKLRLVGQWFQVARSDSWMEADCQGVTATIAARDDSRLTLKLACHKGAPDGPLVPIECVLAEVIPGLYYWRLVRLAQLGDLELAVLWAAQDDSMVVIGARTGQIGWVLARSPDAKVAQGVQVLVDNGYNLAANAPVEQ